MICHRWSGSPPGPAITPIGPRRRFAWTLLAVGLGLVTLALVSTGVGDGSDPWTEPVEKVERELTARGFGAALTAAQEAYQEGLASGGWQPLLLAGQIHRRLGEVTGLRRQLDARARQIYLVALRRARFERSVVGVLGAADAFAALGDGEVTEQCLRIAERLAGNDREAREMVRQAAGRLAAGTSGAMR